MRLNNKSITLNYIVPDTLTIKNVKSVRVPVFYINLNANEAKKCNIKIDDKYINYFVNIGREWYAILRIYGFFGLNTGVFASITNTIFFKINSDLFAFNERKNSFAIKDGKYTILKNNVIGAFRATDSTILQINDNQYSKVESKDEVYYILRKFRNEQIVSFEAKEEVASAAFDLIT